MKYVIYVMVSIFMLSSAVPSFADHHESKEKKEKKQQEPTTCVAIASLQILQCVQKYCERNLLPISL